MQKPGDTSEAPRISEGPCPRWRDKAACRGYVTEYFDPWDSHDKAFKPSEAAAQTCSTCPVRLACLVEAIAHDEPYGTWGGLTLRQRKKLVRAQKRILCPVCSGGLLPRADDNTQACAACGLTWRTVDPSRRKQPTTQEYQSTTRLSLATDTRTS